MAAAAGGPERRERHRHSVEIGVFKWRLPPEDLSAPVRLTAFRLLGRDHNPALYSGNGVLIQGLLHIHRVCCLAVHPDCRSCRLFDAKSASG